MSSDTAHTASPCHSAFLLLGPTGAGKTPLGDLIERNGLWQKECVHFDFGANLRRVVARDRPDELLSRQDIDFLQRVLQTGALLENEHFAIAERVLRSYLAEKRAAAETIVVLNGLPRHVGQAQSIDQILRVGVVISLECSADTVLARIRTDVGGDRRGRPDDDLKAIQNKLEIFGERTAPLIEYYQSRGARIEQVAVTPMSTAREMWETLQRRPFRPSA